MLLLFMSLIRMGPKLIIILWPERFLLALFNMIFELLEIVADYWFEFFLCVSFFIWLIKLKIFYQQRMILEGLFLLFFKLFLCFRWKWWCSIVRIAVLPWHEIVGLISAVPFGYSIIIIVLILIKLWLWIYLFWHFLRCRHQSQVILKVCDFICHAVLINYVWIHIVHYALISL